MHAELLPNIRQLTLYVSLPNLPEPATSSENTVSDISLSESRRAVTVYFTHGEVEVTETLKLPARVSEASRRSLQFAGHRVGVKEGINTADGRRKEFSFRLPLDKDEGVDTATTNGIQDDDFIPWTAEDMSACTSLHCRFCTRVILDGARTQNGSGDTARSGWTWKDLPSGNWAEMMDFWHCHKPDPHEHENEREREQHKTAEDRNASIKGYGAASQVVATPGTILVDVASFLVAEVDCQGFKVRNKDCALVFTRLALARKFSSRWRLATTTLPLLLHSAYRRHDRSVQMCNHSGQQEGGLFARIWAHDLAFDTIAQD